MRAPDVLREPRRPVLVAGALAVVAAFHLLPGRFPAPAIAENRELAAKPGWPAKGEDWWALPKQYDTYVQDRFPPRSHLIGGLNWLRWRIGDSGSSRVIVGRDGWLFYDDGSHLGAARAAVPLSDAEVGRWVSTLQARIEAVGAHDAVYTVLVPPVKERVYPEYAPGWFRDGGAAVDAERLVQGAKSRGLDSVIYLLPALREARTRAEPVYSPYDIHWTGLGAYEGYVRLARHLTAQGVPVEIWPLSRYQRVDDPKNLPRDVALMLGVADFVRHEFPRYDYAPVASKLRTEYLGERHDWTGARVVDTGQAGKPVLLFTGDSFSNDLLPFLYPHFSRLVIAHNQDGFFRADLMERYRPDAVVLEILESGVRHAMTPPMDPSSPAPAPQAEAGIAVRAVPGPPEWVKVRDDGDVATAAAATACNLEVAQRVDGNRDRLRIEGWMFDSRGGRAAAQTRLVLRDGTGAAWTLDAPNAVPRPDVAAHFRAPAAAGAGFAVETAVPDAARAPFEISALQSYGSQTLGCDGRRTVD